MIRVKNPIVEMDGDQMTRVIWEMVKKKLILPYVDVQLEYYDLSLENRDATDNKVTFDAANAIKKHRVGVKCATITPSIAQVKEYNLKKAWPSPNGIIRSELDGTVFRSPITVKNIPTAVRSWRKPISIGRHAYGDIYKGVEYHVPAAGKVELTYLPDDSKYEKVTLEVHKFKAGGVVQAVHNTEASIRAFAKACFDYALMMKQDLWFSAKDTICKTYHTFFKNIFAEEFESRKAVFESAGLAYRYMLIDDAVAQIMKHEGGILWALMNYDGDVMSDMVAAGFGSLGMMTSALVSPSGYYEFEAAHGTVTRHFNDHLKGKETSTNSVATIFAWTGALRKRGELDGNSELIGFAEKLEKAVKETIIKGIMTRDLARIIHNKPEPPRVTWANTEEYIDAVAKRLSKNGSSAKKNGVEKKSAAPKKAAKPVKKVARVR